MVDGCKYSVAGNIGNCTNGLVFSGKNSTITQQGVGIYNFNNTNNVTGSYASPAGSGNVLT